LQLSGPTSFVPIINQTIDIVAQSGKYHILVIIADGQVSNEKENIDAIVEARYIRVRVRVVVWFRDGLRVVLRG
jgi:E3 ubiquitin-protein ligase RGLG